MSLTRRDALATAGAFAAVPSVWAENAFLPAALHRGSGPAAHGGTAAVFRALYAAGVDGVFSDFPGLAVAARGQGSPQA